MLQRAYEAGKLLQRRIDPWVDPPVDGTYDSKLFGIRPRFAREFVVTELAADRMREDDEKFWQHKAVHRIRERSPSAVPLDGKVTDLNMPVSTAPLLPAHTGS